jgi:hypothetical protein
MIQPLELAFDLFKHIDFSLAWKDLQRAVDHHQEGDKVTGGGGTVKWGGGEVRGKNESYFMPLVISVMWTVFLRTLAGRNLNSS